MLKDNKVAEPKSAPWKSTMKGSCIEISSDEDDNDDYDGAKSLALQDFETSSHPENIITISSEDDDGQDEDDDDDDGQNLFGSQSGKTTGSQRNLRNDFGSPFGQSLSSGGDVDSVEFAVPRAAVGVAIGKGSDMIQRETGARVQFQRGCEDDPDEQRCFLSGKPDQVSKARRKINELIDSVLRRDDDRGREGGRGGFDRSGQEKIGASLIRHQPDQTEVAKRMFAEKLGAGPCGAMGEGAGGAQGQNGGGPPFGGQTDASRRSA